MDKTTLAERLNMAVDYENQHFAEKDANSYEIAVAASK